VPLSADIPMLSAPFDMISVADAGEVTHQVFLRQGEYKGQWIFLAAHSCTIEEYANILTSKFPNKKFVAGKVSHSGFCCSVTSVYVHAR